MSGLKRFTGAGILFPLFLVVVTTAYVFAIFDIRTMFDADGGVGPKTLPAVAAIIMYAAVFTVLFSEVKKVLASGEGAGEGDISSHLRPVLVTIATAFYIALFVPLGYGISTLLFVAALFLIFKYKLRQPIAFILYDIAITILFYGLFAGVFNVRLPSLTGYLL